MVITFAVVGSPLPIRTFLAAFASGLSTSAMGSACSSPSLFSQSALPRLRRQHGVSIPRSRAHLYPALPPSYRPHLRPRTARNQYAVPPGPAPYRMACSHLRPCITFNCTYTIYMYHQLFPLPLISLRQLTTSPRAPSESIHH